MNRPKIYISKKIKDLLYKIADSKCQECGIDKKLEIHHIKSKQKGIDNSIENLRLLCKDCHRKIDISNRKAKGRKIIILNVSFEDEDFDLLSKCKGGLSWRKFILTLAEKKECENDGEVSTTA